LTEVGSGDDLEDELERRPNPDGDRAQLVEAAPRPEIEVEAAHRQQQEGAGNQRDQKRAENPDRDPEPGHRVAVRIA
jgi:hypothetical protein